MPGAPLLERCVLAVLVPGPTFERPSPVLLLAAVVVAAGVAAAIAAAAAAAAAVAATAAGRSPCAGPETEADAAWERPPTAADLLSRLVLVVAVRGVFCMRLSGGGPLEAFWAVTAAVVTPQGFAGARGRSVGRPSAVNERCRLVCRAAPLAAAAAVAAAFAAAARAPAAPPPARRGARDVPVAVACDRGASLKVSVWGLFADRGG